MLGIADILRMVTIATVAIFLIFSGLDQSAAALHDVEHGHQDTSAATPGSDHPDASANSCHGVLLCLAAIDHAPDYLSQPTSMQRIRNRKHSNLLSHVAHPVFEPPPPRIAV